MIHSGSMLPESWYLLGVKKNLSHTQKTGSRYLLGFFFQSFNRHPNSFYMGAPKVVKPLSCLHILCFGILRSDYNDAGYYFGKYWRCIKINLTLFFMWSSFFSEACGGWGTLDQEHVPGGVKFSCPPRPDLEGGGIYIDWCIVFSSIGCFTKCLQNLILI